MTHVTKPIGVTLHTLRLVLLYPAKVGRSRAHWGSSSKKKEPARLADHSGAKFTSPSDGRNEDYFASMPSTITCRASGAFFSIHALPPPFHAFS